eukprot:jgi/Astpho2/3833/Aster-x1177
MIGSGRHAKRVMMFEDLAQATPSWEAAQGPGGTAPGADNQHTQAAGLVVEDGAAGAMRHQACPQPAHRTELGFQKSLTHSHEDDASMKPGTSSRHGHPESRRYGSFFASSVRGSLRHLATSSTMKWSSTLGRHKVVEYWAYCRRRLITSMVVVLFFFYPDLSENVANVFACYPMQFGTYSNGNNGEHTVFYWTQDTTQICFRGSHFWLTMTVGIPGALLICIGIPAGFAGILYKNRDHLNDPEIKKTYGFLYSGYKPQYYFWESVTLSRNLLLVVLVFVAPGMGVYIQAHLVLAVLVVSLLVQGRLRPFSEPIIDHMELISVGSITLSMYISLYFLSYSQPLSLQTQQGLGWVLVGILASTLGWYLKNIFGRKKTILALLRSTRSARKNLARLRTLMRSGRDPRRQRSLSSTQ